MSTLEGDERASDSYQDLICDSVCMGQLQGRKVERPSNEHVLDDDDEDDH